VTNNKINGRYIITALRKWIRKVDEWDTRLFLKLYESDFSKKNKKIAKIISSIGNGFFFIGTGIFTLILAFLINIWYFSYLFIGGLIQSTIIYVIVRKIVDRNRPYIKLGDLGVERHDNYTRQDTSFPSGHITFFMFFGIVFAFYFNDYFVIIFVATVVLDIAISVSRIILAAHFPLDVVAGFAFGIFLAMIYLGATYSIWIQFLHCSGQALKSAVGIT